MMENNRQFELMRFAARQKLEGADPVQLSVLTGLCWDGRTFDTETLGIPIRISWPECQISPVLEMWHDLTILQYLANTKGTTLMGKFLALSEFHAGGLAKGTSFDRDNDRIISRIGLHDPQAIREAAAKLGGTELHEKSDLSFLFSFLPHIPIKFNLWLPDEEFPASGKVLFDASAENDLQIEAAGTAAAICLSLLERGILYELTDAQWDRIRDLIPRAKTGRPPKDDRMMLNAMLWLARSGAAWVDIPARFGPHQTVYSRFCKWRDDGTLLRIFQELNADADYENLCIDSTSIKAHPQSAGAKRGL